MAEELDYKIAQMSLVDWLDDLTVRFLLNLPPAELSSVPRLCFQVEEAQWFYEDFIRPANPTLPSLNLRQFLLTLFQHCPLLSGFDATQHVAAYEEFLRYKVRVPVRGAIMMDESMEKVLLVRGWKKGASWSFPRGKINKDEKDLDCAIREVYEETGYDIAAAGLVESNQQHGEPVKAIDITMREQHMKLFVFRGVPLETYFEPRTRKEISKISWYNIKDLPGFKKQKGVAGQGQGEAATSKFYMVAPFLGHLKKWIGQQRRHDHAAATSRHSRSLSANNDLLGSTEDEVDTEQEFTNDSASGQQNRSADELKRLLSIGNSLPTPTSFTQHPQSSGHTNHLLAMLKGSHPSLTTGQPPQTPIEQTDPAVPIAEPETPQPHHPRDPSVTFQDPSLIPQFPFSPQRIQQQHQQQNAQRQGFMDTAHNNAWPPPGQHAQYLQTPMHSQNLPQQHNAQTSQPMFQSAQLATHHFDRQENVMEGSIHPNYHVQSTHMAVLGNAAFPRQISRSSPGYGTSYTESHAPTDHLTPQTAQDTRNPLASEYVVPDASRLPLPNLNEHSLKLLDAFKSTGGHNTGTKVPPANVITHRENRQQQAALLDLFKKNSNSSALFTASNETATVATPASPALTDATVKPIPPSVLQRTPVPGEIAESSPAAAKANPPVSSVTPAHLTSVSQSSATQMRPVQGPESQRQHHSRPQRATRDAASEERLVERPKSGGQLFNPSKPQKFARSATQMGKPEKESGNPSAVSNQKHLSRQMPRSPKGTSKVKPSTISSQGTSSVPQFSILQRQTSSVENAARPSAPQSPGMHTGFLPQVLKRADTGREGILQGSIEKGVTSVVGSEGDARKGHLLSLFGKPAIAPNNGNNDSTAVRPQGILQQQNDVFGQSNGAAAVPTSIQTMEPPAAPRLLPEHKPSNREPQSHQISMVPGQTSQQNLLNLFYKTSSMDITSPGTPVSPFTLSSPAAGSSYHTNDLPLQAAEPRSRLGSVPSVISNGKASGQQTPKNATPTAEAKDFLLGYLNGVVQKEGYRSAKNQ